jgi:alanine dehydrogenase
MNKNSLFIGILKETSFQENRVPLVPNAVALLCNNGHEIILESGAGKLSNFSDGEYSEAGAKIVYNTEDIFKANIILKIAPPTENEILYLKANHSLISMLQFGTQTEKFFLNLASKKVNALAFDFIKDKIGIYSIIQSMSEIAGSTSMLIAAEYLSNVKHGRGEMLGGITGIPPSNVVIIGAGTVGEFAARTAIGLGANVEIFDSALYKLRRLQNHLGSRLFTSILSPDTLARSLKNSDVAIGAMAPKNGISRCIVSEEMVSQMSAGSVIIDVNIDVGGCFETSEIRNHSDPTFIKYGVIHYCVPNIPSRVAHTASYAISNVITPILLNIGKAGGLAEFVWFDQGVRFGIYMYKGIITKKHISEQYKMPYKDIELLLASQKLDLS